MNRFAISALVLAAIVAVGYSEDLCMPEEWEGYQGAIGGYIYLGKPVVFTEHNYVAYDLKTRRVAIFVRFNTGNQEKKFQLVFRFDSENVGQMYVVEEASGICFTKTLHTEFKRTCIPADAKLYREYNIGPFKGGLPVSGYLFTRAGIDIYVSVSKQGDVVIPVTEVVHGSFGGSTYLTDFGYADVKLSVKNQTMFDIPKECMKQTSSFIPEFLQRQYFFLGL